MATDMAQEGMVNVGQLLREQHDPDHVFIIGFGTYEGTVIAADAWGDPYVAKTVPPAKKGSFEQILHQAGSYDKWLRFTKENTLFQDTVGHRAIGVVYDPDFEHNGNYVPSKMANRYDAFIYIDKTTALHPLAIEKLKI
jgi:erythromycin esterase-like protein